MAHRAMDPSAGFNGRIFSFSSPQIHVRMRIAWGTTPVSACELALLPQGRHPGPPASLSVGRYRYEAGLACSRSTMGKIAAVWLTADRSRRTGTANHRALIPLCMAPGMPWHLGGPGDASARSRSCSFADCWRNSCLSVAGSNRKSSIKDSSKILGFPSSKCAPARKSAQIISAICGLSGSNFAAARFRQ